jgi:hypothetical protein
MDNSALRYGWDMWKGRRSWIGFHAVDEWRWMGRPIEEERCILGMGDGPGDEEEGNAGGNGS